MKKTKALKKEKLEKNKKQNLDACFSSFVNTLLTSPSFLFHHSSFSRFFNQSLHLFYFTLFIYPFQFTLHITHIFNKNLVFFPLFDPSNLVHSPSLQHP
ncbi:hypothetical protein QVD17_17249 [Tagetes erecta]|uniref:Uncharacterized protein n=1 Tax=Tagetes erecta TaxID=13708 RepID=A0AAD8NU64_TARER|nr:hypothetical protein QVD17_17249 [Tagetes erecta]